MRLDSGSVTYLNVFNTIVVQQSGPLWSVLALLVWMLMHFFSKFTKKIGDHLAIR